MKLLNFGRSKCTRIEGIPVPTATDESSPPTCRFDDEDVVQINSMPIDQDPDDNDWFHDEDDLRLALCVSPSTAPTLWICQHSSLTRAQLATASRGLHSQPIRVGNTVSTAHGWTACGLPLCEKRFCHRIERSAQGFHVRTTINVISHKLPLEQVRCERLALLTNAAIGLFSKPKAVRSLNSIITKANGNLRLCDHMRLSSERLIETYLPRCHNISKADPEMRMSCLCSWGPGSSCKTCDDCMNGKYCRWNWRFKIFTGSHEAHQQDAIPNAQEQGSRSSDVKVCLYLELIRGVGQLDLGRDEEEDYAWLNASEVRWGE